MRGWWTQGRAQLIPDGVIYVDNKHNVDYLCKVYNYGEKLIINLSTEQGCSMNCSFCECWRNGAKGNVPLIGFRSNLNSLCRFVSDDIGITKVDRVKVYFARCGEPTLNNDIFPFVEEYMESIIRYHISTREIFPLISTIFPVTESEQSEKFLIRWAYYKKYKMNGRAGLQFSINSSDDYQRNKMFGGKVQCLKSLSSFAYKNLPYTASKG